MGNLSKLIADFIADPTKIEALPDILAAADTLEKSELDAYAMVEKTQSTNRSLLQRISTQPEPEAKPEEKPATAEDITSSLVDEMFGGKE